MTDAECDEYVEKVADVVMGLESTDAVMILLTAAFSGVVAQCYADGKYGKDAVKDYITGAFDIFAECNPIPDGPPTSH